MCFLLVIFICSLYHMLLYTSLSVSYFHLFLKYTHDKQLSLFVILSIVSELISGASVKVCILLFTDPFHILCASTVRATICSKSRTLSM